jgi:hypothetical protein
MKFKNESDKDTIRFALRGKEREVKPGATIDIDDTLAYAIPLMQVRLSPVEEAKPEPEAKPPKKDG